MRECCFKTPDHYHNSSHLRMTRENDVPNIQIKRKALAWPLWTRGCTRIQMKAIGKKPKISCLQWASPETVCLQRTFLVGHKNSVTPHIDLSKSTKSCAVCNGHWKEVQRCHARNGRRVPTLGCASASLQRGKDFPAASKEVGAWKAQCEAKKTGMIEEKLGREIPSSSTVCKNSAVFHAMWRLQAMVPEWTQAQWSKVR